MDTGLNHPKAKKWIFIMEGLNAVATTLYAYYLFFYTTHTFGFDRKSNLILAAAHGLVFAVSAWVGGHFAERVGWKKAMMTGIAIMMLMLALSLKAALPWQLAALFLLWTMGVSVTWPTLESMISRASDINRMPDNLGVYNLVWAAGAAIAFFFGGFVTEHLGAKSIFWIPFLLHACQFIAITRLDRLKLSPMDPTPSDGRGAVSEIPAAAFPHRPIVRTRFFLHLAWISNPFSYIAINTLVPMIPSFADRLGLGTGMTGFVCSIWLFARVFTFVFLWKNTSWHYQFNGFLLGFSLLVASFLGMLLSKQLLFLVLFQIGFGYAIGFLYYSSLLYSMFSGEGSSSHSGIHEASIGLGICLGPAVSATALHLAPGIHNAGVFAASIILLGGLATSLIMRFRFNKKETYDSSRFKP